jgi:hypothetical protein
VHAGVKAFENDRRAGAADAAALLASWASAVRAVILGLVLCIGASGHALAWGDMGHRAVIGIAIEDLKPTAAAGIADLLPGGTKALFEVASWADEVLDQWPESYPWHAVDIPHEGIAYDRQRDCPSDDCIVEQITRFAHRLADRALPADDRLIALKMVVHLVGDLHVPLHAYQPDPGWGGWEGPWIRIGDNTDQLHMWWDEGFVFEVGPDASWIAEALAEEITADERAEWVRTGPDVWANESFLIARDFLVRHQLIESGSRITSEDDPIVLAPSVLDEARSIVAWRLKMAGVRLAGLLNKAFE